MAEIVIPYHPREHQRYLHDNLQRWNLIICHRRFGKTVWAINQILKDALTSKLKAPRYAYIAPLLKQAKAIAWDYLKFFSRAIPGTKIHETELRIDYPNGARIRLFGADNPDALRGLYLDGVVLDEYAQISPNMFSEVLRPALSDRKGYAVFMGTPNGRNHFWDLFEQVKKAADWFVSILPVSKTKIIDQEELDSAKRLMSDDEYDQEYECSFTAAAKGSYFGDLMKQIRDQGHIRKILIEPTAPVHTFWDLGRNDANAIWFMQHIGQEYRFIDYEENNGEGLSFYARMLQQKGYIYGDHYLPHDVEVTELTTNKNRRETLEGYGVRPIRVVSRIPEKNEAIQMARNVIPLSMFDEERCADGIRALENYRREWDDKRQVFRSYPLHDWASNGSDGYMQFAQGYQPRSNKPKTPKTTVMYY